MRRSSLSVSSIALFALVVYIVGSLTLAHAIIFDLKETTMEPGSSYIYRVGMWSPLDAPAGNDPSFAEFDVDIKYPDPKAKGKAFLTFYAAHHEDVIGEASGQEKRYCSPDGSVTSTDPSLVKPLEISIPGKIKERFHVSQSAVHYFVISSCSEAKVDDNPMPDLSFSMNGKLSFVNPYGQLPGGYYRLLPFYLSMSFLYIVVAAVWGYMCWKKREELHKMQLSISAVLGLSVLESLSWYFELNGLNQNGYVSSVALGFSVLFTLLRKTFARLLILVCVMGWGIIKPDLGNEKWRVGAFAVVYLIAGALHESVNALYRAHSITYFTLVVFAIPVAILDSILYTWIFFTLLQTLKTVDEGRDTEKHQLFRQFAWILGSYSVCALFWMVYVTYLNSTRDYVEQWQGQWTLDAFWEVLYFIVLLSIMVIWRPTDDNSRYSYVELRTFDDEDSEEDNAIAVEPVDPESGRALLSDKQRVPSGNGSIPVARIAGGNGATGNTARGSFGLADDDDLFEEEEEEELSISRPAPPKQD